MTPTPSPVRLPAHNHAGYQRVVRVTWIGIAVTSGLCVVKMVAGLLTASTALLADGLESLSDTGVALATAVGLKIASQPADARHPYGHGKAEVLSAGFIAWALVMVAIVMGGRAIWQIFHPDEHPAPHWAALLFLGGTCLLGEGLYRYKMYYAQRLQSAALRAEAFDHRKDVWSSLIGFVAVALAIALGGRWTLLDPVAGLITCGFIGWMAIQILRETAPHLMDQAVSGPLLGEIRVIAEDVDGVKGTEKLIARQSGLDVLVELHIEVDPQMTVDAAHDIATAVRDRIIERVQMISEVLVHVEPFYEGDHVNPPKF